MVFETMDSHMMDILVDFPQIPMLTMSKGNEPRRIFYAPRA